MNRPLTPHERVEIELLQCDQLQSPAVTDLVAATMFQVGMVLGHYPTGRVRVLLRPDDASQMLIMQLTLTIPLEELGG